MAEKTLKLEIVTPSRLLVDEDVQEITAPGVEGQFGVLPGHTPFLTELGMGVIVYRKGTEKQIVAVRKGIAEVKHEKVIVLAEEAEFVREIDLEAATAESAAAAADLERLKVAGPEREYLKAQDRLDRANNRIYAVTRQRQSH